MAIPLLNCDMGESFGNWSIGLDAEVMPHVDCANIACGYHASDPPCDAQDSEACCSARRKNRCPSRLP